MKKKIGFLALATILSVGLLVTKTSAVDNNSSSDISLFGGQVPLINNITITGLSLFSSATNLQSTALVNSNILKYMINNNNPDGFIVRFSSAKGGKLVRQSNVGSDNTGGGQCKKKSVISDSRS